MYEVIKTLEISAAHRLELPYESPCTNLHGHNWRVKIFLRSETLNAEGMIMDFKKIKEKITNKLDHKILNEAVDFNPTAENLAKYICDEIAPYCYRTEVCESENNTAVYYKD